MYLCLLYVVPTSTVNSEAIPTSTSTADSKATNGIIFGLAFGLGISVIVLGLAVILVFLKYQYHHRKQATRNNWYAHIIIKLHLNEFFMHQDIDGRQQTSRHL